MFAGPAGKQVFTTSLPNLDKAEHEARREIRTSVTSGPDYLTIIHFK